MCNCNCMLCTHGPLHGHAVIWSFTANCLDHFNGDKYKLSTTSLYMPKRIDNDINITWEWNDHLINFIKIMLLLQHMISQINQ